MRIAYVLTQDRGGPVDVTTGLIGALDTAGGHDVLLIGPEPARDADVVAAVRRDIAVASKSDWRAAAHVRAELRRFAPDIVHAQDRRSGLVVAGLRQLRWPGRTAPRLVHTYHGVPEDVSQAWFAGYLAAPPPSRYTRAVLAGDAMLARTLTTVVPATAMARFLHHRLRVPTARIHQISNGIELGEPGPSVHRVRRLLFVGLLVPRKGVLTLLEALAKPGVLPPDAQVSIAGDGPARAAAEAFLAGPARAVRHQISFLGFRADVGALLRSHDALVLPSHMEQQPVAVAEAMAAGRPVVATDTGGVREMLDVPGSAGFVVPPTNAAALATALRRLFGCADLQDYGSQLRLRAQERFGAATAAERHLQLYRRLTQGVSD